MFLRVTVNVFYILNDVFVLILKLQFLTRQNFFFSWQHKKGKIFILQRNTVYVKDLFDDILKNIEAEKNIKNYLIEGEDVTVHLRGQITFWACTQDLTIFSDSPTLGASETGKMKIRTVWTLAKNGSKVFGF